jgi:hypothetical protein
MAGAVSAPTHVVVSAQPPPPVAEAAAAAATGAAESVAAAAAVPTFSVDAVSAALAAGDRPRYFCLTVNVGCPPPPEVRAAYGAHVSRLRAALGTGADAWYFAPPEALHVTIVALVMFTSTAFAAHGAAERVTGAWGRWLAREMPRVLRGRPPLALVMRRPELSPAAAFFRYDDDEGVGALRRAISAARGDPDLVAAGAFGEGTGFRVPGIVHSTYARPCGRVAEPGATAAAFAAAATAWRPLRYTAPRLLAVIEDVPYMHEWRPLFSGEFVWAPPPRPPLYTPVPDVDGGGGPLLTFTPLTPRDAEPDYCAVLRDAPMLRAWSGSTWPADGFTLAENAADVAAHAEEAATGVALTYSVRLAGVIVGCVYARPLLDALRTRGVAVPVDDGGGAIPAGTRCSDAVVRAWAHDVPARVLLAAALEFVRYPRGCDSCAAPRVWWQANAACGEQLAACDALGMSVALEFSGDGPAAWFLRAMPGAA